MTKHVHYLPFALLYLLLLGGCEKSETIRQSNGAEFCPLAFRAYPQTGPLDGCGLIFTPLYDPVFKTENDGVVMKALLKKQNTPFVAADPNPNTIATRYLGFHRTEPKCEFELTFEKINMAEATRVSLYIGKTTTNASFSNFYMGDVLNKIPPGPSPKHLWQVFIQRDLAGTYTLGYVANGTQFIAQSGIPDFKMAFFSISNFSGESIFKVDLKGPSGTVGSIETKSIAIPENYFGAFGFDILEAQQTDCTDRLVEIKLQKYLYVGGFSQTRYEDNFECNTIWSE
jgi:hypothetical protein